MWIISASQSTDDDRGFTRLSAGLTEEGKRAFGKRNSSADTSELLLDDLERRG